MPPLSPTPIFLGLGTNLGDRRANLQRAVRALTALTRIRAISPLYQTAPWGVTNQPDFLNLCLSATTTLPPRALLAELKRLERTLGRQPGLRWGPRLIDIDILFYGAQIVTEAGLTIPHPRLAERAFVLAPLADIAPNWQHPQTGLTVAQMLAQVDTSGVHRLDTPLL
ncbi:MAG: 2-amino-4-hydroxy-6-hydroxymethyldihydropteridine diphosphokinase [Caldilineae bacterium]|nr:MAG: 2-amino-4-hydroxy-6-hydroxymethyldihydropteridine diphosphokinase [Caldilineae bacterium]